MEIVVELLSHSNYSKFELCTIDNGQFICMSHPFENYMASKINELLEQKE